MTRKNDPLSILRDRGLVAQVSDEAGVRSLLGGESTSIYVGFDPTGSSLHVGHLLPVIVLSRLQRMGHRPIILIGGATGMIGDPSGKSAERGLLTPEIVQENIRGVRSQLEQYVEFAGDNGAVIVNNNDWISKISYIDWLRDVGKHFSINYMIAKESVRKRLDEREQGISYTEFSYMLLQAYDFLHLSENFGCRLQGGGNDQWGNITAGIELVRKVRREEAFGITFPLMTTADGQKFGKSEGNAVWLNPEMTSPYKFYQYWMQADDKDVANYLRCFTFLELEAIAELMVKHEGNPEERLAQRTLAQEVTGTVHGVAGVKSAERATAAFFGQGMLEELSEGELFEVFASAPSFALSRDRLGAVSVVELLAECGVCASKGAARRLVEQGGIYLNGERVEKVGAVVVGENLLAGGSVLVLRIGKKKHVLVRVEG